MAHCSFLKLNDEGKKTSVCRSIKKPGYSSKKKKKLVVGSQ